MIIFFNDLLHYSVGNHHNLIFQSAKKTNFASNLKMQKESIVCSHGKLGEGKNWKQPRLTAKSQEISRPGYNNIKANEFEDHPDVFQSKIKLLAQMIKNSHHCVVYTGAGISRASGIADYATKAKNSKAGSENHSLNRLQAQPTTAHYVITEMERAKLVKHWVQQNHDGLAQKSGFPLSKLNQIHGSWFDKKNSVVLMDDCLNPKNYKLLEEWEEKVDVCLAIGTSLCGMRSDGIAKKACSRGGLVIINLQQTPYDEQCQLRLYGNLQTIIEKLGKALGIKVTKRICISNPYEWNK